MNLQHVLLSPNGRIGQQEYWIGILILIAGNIVSNFIPFLGFFIGLFLIYVGVCVYGKRLHDIGKTAWIHGIVWLIQIGLWIVGIAVAGGAIISAIMSGGGDEAAMMAAFTASGGIFLVMGLSLLIWIVYTVWVGVSAGDAGENRFGPAAAVAAPAAAAAPAAEPAPEPASEAPAEDAPSGDSPEENS